MSSAPSTRLAQLMERTGVSASELARLVGTTRQQVFKLRTGERQMSAAWAMRLAPHLGVDWPSIIAEQGVPNAEPPRQETSPSAIRIAAVRRCVWPAIEQAAADLSIPLAQFEAVEAGAEQFTPAQLLRFCARAGCTEGFIVQGDMDGVRWVLVAWLGHTAPELVPGLLEMAQQARAVSGEDDGEG